MRHALQRTEHGLQGSKPVKRLLFAIAAIATLALLKRQIPEISRISVAGRETQVPLGIAASDQPGMVTATQGQGLEANRPVGPADAELLLNR
jgi:hypothetical protein